jgi:hypothetical protein
MAKKHYGQPYTYWQYMVHAVFFGNSRQSNNRSAPRIVVAASKGRGARRGRCDLVSRQPRASTSLLRSVSNLPSLLHRDPPSYAQNDVCFAPCDRGKARGLLGGIASGVAKRMSYAPPMRFHVNGAKQQPTLRHRTSAASTVRPGTNAKTTHGGLTPSARNRSKMKSTVGDDMLP